MWHKVYFDFWQIKHDMGQDKLLRIRNPWGNEIEWKGSWSDQLVTL